MTRNETPVPAGYTGGNGSSSFHAGFHPARTLLYRVGGTAIRVPPLK
jgi:hypothetical protein